MSIALSCTMGKCYRLAADVVARNFCIFGALLPVTSRTSQPAWSDSIEAQVHYLEDYVLSS